LVDEVSPLNTLSDNLISKLNQKYPRFSNQEFERRRNAFEAAMERQNVRHVIIRGALKAGSSIQWLTGWPVTAEAIIIYSIGEKPNLYVQHYNHLPLATQLAHDCDVFWGGASGIESALKDLKKRGAENNAIGLVGTYSLTQIQRLQEFAKSVVDMTRDYIQLRLIKSSEELDWLRIGSALTDYGISALKNGLEIGMDEREMGAIVESGYLDQGGENQIHFFGVTSMNDPDCCVPRQFPSTRKIASGDVLTTEISSHFWDYSGQVLRTFTINAEPSPLYQELHDVAEAAFEAILGVLRPGTTPDEIINAASVIEDAGFTIYDDLVHGYGGGYLPPVLGSKSRMNSPVPTMTLEAGMCLVVQPNVITPDEKAGVQTGEMMLITETGSERMHSFPRGLQALSL
jgi:Xaa-Pro dipeptidase